MAITAAKTTADFSGFIKPEQAGFIFEDAKKQSAVMQLATQQPLGASGKEFPIVTGKPVANWVSEAGQKPSTEASLGLIPMKPKKLAAIAVTSAEVVRANPGGYSEKLRELLAEAFATAFDLAAAYNVGGDGTGTGPFDHYLAETTKSVTLGTGGTLYDDLVSGVSLLLTGKKKARGFAFDSAVEVDFLGAKDTNGRPLFAAAEYTDSAESVQRGRLLGRTSYLEDDFAHGTTVGFLGDWSKAAWGVVGSGISYDVSTQATVTINGALTSLWEHNLVAVRAEAEYGFVVADTEAFAKFVRSAG
jgi:Phage capsid family.